MAMYLTGSFPNRSGNICSQHPLPSKSSREVTKEQTANLYHRNFTSAGYSASSVEKYHYPSDCHRRNRGNLLLIPGVLAVLQCRSLGVPDKVAKIIRNKVLVNDLFSCQSTSERLPFSWFGINPFTHLDKGGQNAHPKSPLFQKFLEKIFLNEKKPPIFIKIEVNRRRVEIFIILMYNKKLRERQI